MNNGNKGGKKVAGAKKVIRKEKVERKLLD
jgi:hypothetical protein